MKSKNSLRHCWRLALYGLAGGMLAGPLSGQAAVANVAVKDDFFSPANITINVNDQVVWTWAGGGVISHNTTSTGLWDSGFKTSGSYTNTFSAAGDFPYFCTLHRAIGMIGSITVQAATAPPSVAITAPTSGATFAAPWTGTIQATSSATGATVSTLDFFATGAYLGTVTNPPANASFTVTNLQAGDYTLTALATDSLGATNTSAGVAISVVTPAAITLSSPQRVSATSFQFKYSAVPSLRYVVLRSGALMNFSPISTNTAASNTETFLDANATDAVNYYRVQVAPNP
jgi:plastocyanin